MRLLPVRNIRATSHVIIDQKNTSNAVVDKRWKAAKAWGDVAAATPAITWATRRPPSSRAVSALTNTVAAPAKAESARNQNTDGPKTTRTRRATAGTSGGWST